MEILAQSSTAFVLTHNFQGTHILGASRGRLSDSVASCIFGYLLVSVSDSDRTESPTPCIVYHRKTLLLNSLNKVFFYRVMLCVVQLWDCMSSVRLSDCDIYRYRDHIGWNSSKIISRPNSLRPMRLLTPTWAIWSTGTTPKLGWNRGGVRST